MRNKIQQQLPIVYPFIAHEHARELSRISDILDQIPAASTLVYDDLIAHGPRVSTGRLGLAGDQALRALLLKQMNGFSYVELAFHLADSRFYRAFCGLGIDEKSPEKSALQKNIKRIQPETLELINRLVLEEARLLKVENGRKVLVDCTVVESNIHHPTDSSLLYDCVRVLAREMESGRRYFYQPHSAGQEAGPRHPERKEKEKAQRALPRSFAGHTQHPCTEGMISFLKRCFGVGRCTWQGLISFKLYVWVFQYCNRIILDARAVAYLLFSPWGQFSDFEQDQSCNFNVLVVFWGKLILMGPETHMVTGSCLHRKCLIFSDRKIPRSR